MLSIPTGCETRELPQNLSLTLAEKADQKAQGRCGNMHLIPPSGRVEIGNSLEWQLQEHQASLTCLFQQLAQGGTRQSAAEVHN